MTLHLSSLRVSVLLPRLGAGAWKAQRDVALTIGVKLVQRSAERGSTRRAAVIFDTAFASGEAPRALGWLQSAGARGVEVRESDLLVKPRPPGSARCAPLC